MTVISQDDIDKAVGFLYNRYTRDNYRSALAPFVGVEPTRKGIQQIVASWGDDASSTIMVRRSALIKLVEYMSSVERCDEDVLVKFKFPKGRPPKQIRALTDDELDQFFKSATMVRERLLATILFDSGLRAGFVPKIRYKDLKLDSFRIQVKNGTNVDVYPTKEMAELSDELMDELGAKEDDYVFTSGGKPVTYKTIYRMFNSIAERAKISDVTPHSARHTFATRLSSIGVPVPDIAALMGHKSVQTTLRYVHPNSGSLKQAVQNIAQSRRQV